MSERADLGQALRALRMQTGLTEGQLAGKLGITQTSVSRYEVGTRLPTFEMLDRIADALGVPKRVRQQLLEQLHGAQTQVRSARSIAQRGLGRRQGEIARTEAQAKHIRNFQAALVPGLLQTPNYARRIFEGGGRAKSAEDLARALAARLDRQAILHDSEKRFGFVILEAVLLLPRGSIQDMLAQLDRLQSVSELPNVDLAVLPLGVEPPRSPINSFDIYDDDLVHVETLTEQLALRDPSDVALYVKAYEAFRDAAVSGPAARELFDSAAARLRQA